MEHTFTWTKISKSTFLDFYSELFLLRFFMFVIYFCTWYGRFIYDNNLFNHVELYLMRHEFPFTVCLSHFWSLDFLGNSRSWCFCGISVSQIDSQIKSIHKHSNIPGLRLKEIHKLGLNQKHPSPTIKKLKLRNIMNVGSNFNRINIYNTLKIL